MVAMFGDEAQFDAVMAKLWPYGELTSRSRAAADGLSSHYDQQAPNNHATRPAHSHAVKSRAF
jgi:hypothetical protein